MRKKIAAANWKMYKNRGEAQEYAQQLLALTGSDQTDAEVIICPPFTCLHALHDALRGSLIKTGAQDLFWETAGAFTGEISALMLTDCGCSYVIVGHSERRHILNESDHYINRKVKAALAGGLDPILCVGETLQERQNDVARQVVKEQLEHALLEVELAAGRLIVAYEPVWAIGTGINASPDDAQDMIAFIREQMGQLYSPRLAAATPILYGGSVKAANMHDFIVKNDIDGALVGSASLDPREFSEIVRSIENG
ncbi:MAG TPA: triose-phosphate isomerase [Syntrophomonas sp.]|nr:triose-phosphate isomerase [Syntrophomonas sp.]